MKPSPFATSLAACKVGLLSTAILLVGAGGASAASFENYLERGYSEVAVYARIKAQNTGASLHFAQKAADAASGRVVTPDSPADTGRPVAYLAEQYDAYNRLMEVLAAGAAKDNARMAAVAQINYDCWLAGLSAGPGEPDSNACRLLFYTALDQIVASPDMDDFVTLAGPVSTDGSSDHGAGGNDNPDRLPTPGPAVVVAHGAPGTSSRQLDAGPISALSPLASGEYSTAAWIYPVPVAMPPTPAPAAGAASEHATDTSAQQHDAEESAGTGPGVTGALGGAVDGTSESLGGTVRGVGGALGGTVGGASAAVGGAVSGAGGAVGGPVGGVADAAGNAVSGLGGAAGGAVSGVADATGGAISGVGGAVGGALGGLGKERAN